MKEYIFPKKYYVIFHTGSGLSGSGAESPTPGSTRTDIFCDTMPFDITTVNVPDSLAEPESVP
ncbi:MAG: hypothetical protein IIZ47_05540, partial [Erysipelotrichaceae bacterium]|nr:hypothetical protein [Erysipelotrichaceae bacterium]